MSRRMLDENCMSVDVINFLLKNSCSAALDFLHRIKILSYIFRKIPVHYSVAATIAFLKLNLLYASE